MTEELRRELAVALLDFSKNDDPLSGTICINRIFSLFKQAGYVQLDDDQEVELYPEVFASGLNLPTQAEMDMLKKFLSWLKHEASFKKVKSASVSE